MALELTEELTERIRLVAEREGSTPDKVLAELVELALDKGVFSARAVLAERAYSKRDKT